MEAAHIRPVGAQHDGPDSPRNGIALSRTMHWLFDNRLVTITDDYQLLLANSHVPERARRLFAKDLKLSVVPSDPRLRPHPQFLRYHRDHLFMG